MIWIKARKPSVVRINSIVSLILQLEITMIVYHHYTRSRGNVGSNPGTDTYVEVRPENEAEEKLLMSLSGAIHIGHGDWRLNDQLVKCIGGRPMYAGPTEAYIRLKNVFTSPDHCNVTVIEQKLD